MSMKGLECAKCLNRSIVTRARDPRHTLPRPTSNSTEAWSRTGRRNKAHRARNTLHYLDRKQTVPMPGPVVHERNSRPNVCRSFAQYRTWTKAEYPSTSAQRDQARTSSMMLRYYFEAPLTPGCHPRFLYARARAGGNGAW